MTTTMPAPRMVLPGQWGRIDLSSEAASRRSIRKILDDVTHRRDDMAQTRAGLRERFQTAADAAREGGASEFFVAKSLTSKIPLPAWASIFTPEIDSVDFAALGLADLQTFLDAGTKNWGPTGAAQESLTAGEGRIHAVRHNWRRTRDVQEGDAHVTFEFVEADYWLAATDPNRIALVTFSTALAEYEEEMLALFDAVVSTIRWPAEASA